MKKHTPGPWTVTEVGPAPRYMIAGAATSVAMTYGQSGQQADARLIAAAPELLAALQAIADAEGDATADRADVRDGWRLAHAKLCGYARAAIAKINA